MADTTRATFQIARDSLMLVGTGGDVRTRPVYRSGSRVEGEVQTREGSPVHRLGGMSVSISGVGLDGAEVETLTPLENVEAGMIFRAEGICEVSVRAEGRTGFGGGDPRGVLRTTVFVQTLTPVGSITELLASQIGRSRTKADA